MIYTVFAQGFAITILFSLSFILGGYISFKILNTQYQKEKVLFRKDIQTTDDLKDKLKNTIIKLVKTQKSNVNILVLYDKLFAEVLVEVAKEVSFENKELVETYLQSYLLQRNKFTEQPQMSQL